MKIVPFLATAFLVILNSGLVMSSDRKYKRVAVKEVEISKGEDPWGPFRVHIRENNLTPRTIDKNCVVSMYFSYLTNKARFWIDTRKKSLPPLFYNRDYHAVIRSLVQ